MIRFGEGETARLLCTRPDPDSLDAYRRLFTDEEVNRWLRPPPMSPFTEDEVKRLYLADRAHWRNHGYGPWLLFEREGGSFIGRGGLAWTRVEERPELELPWALLAEFHGLGYATEQALAAIETARSFGVGQLVSLTLPENIASRRVMEKAGLTFSREVEHAGLTHVLYELEPSGGQ